MTQNQIKKIKSKKQKTRFWRHMLVFFVCFLIACVTWLSVMYTKQEEAARTGGARTGVTDTAEAETSALARLANG